MREVLCVVSFMSIKFIDVYHHESAYELIIITCKSEIKGKNSEVRNIVFNP